MADKSSIEWTEATWNPTTGCTKVSPGCDHCYAERIVERFRGKGSFAEVVLHDDRLDLPLKWRKPRRVFVNSMSDLFHDDVPDYFIGRVFAVMALATQHVFQVLTKRHGRMRSLLCSAAFRVAVLDAAYMMVNGEVAAVSVPPAAAAGYRRRYDAALLGDVESVLPWPLPNVWLGVSVEDQHWADIRIPALLDTPAAVRFLSAEPMLGAVDLTPFVKLEVGGADALATPTLHWVITGGESGPSARPAHPDWYRAIRDVCTAAGIAYFHKQHGEWAPIGPLYDQCDDDEEADEARMDAVGWEVEEKKRVVQLESSGRVADGYQPGDPRTWLMVRLGKKRAGRVLDGRTWDEYPGQVA